MKLWKHHAAQPEADRINEVAAERGEPWLPRYGGKISSEWFFAKALQILDEAPEIYARAEPADRGRPTGSSGSSPVVETRTSCTAGYKAMWSKTDGFPSRRLLRGARPGASSTSSTRRCRARSSRSAAAQAASASRRRPGRGCSAAIAVAVANVDAHVSAPAVRVTEPGRLVTIMGTSTCHVALGDRLEPVDGMCGVVEDGVVPGLFGYEAGQSAVGDIFAWFVENAVPPRYQGADVHEALARRGREAQAGRDRACSHSTGGTATVPCSSMPTCAG